VAVDEFRTSMMDPFTGLRLCEVAVLDGDGKARTARGIKRSVAARDEEIGYIPPRFVVCDETGALCILLVPGFWS
jgi:hypothetical protein